VIYRPPTTLRIAQLMRLILGCALFPMCAWLSFRMLELVARSLGNAALAKSIALRKWLVGGAVLANQLLWPPVLFLLWGFRTSEYVEDTVMSAAFLLIMESTLILGRAWQAVEGRTDQLNQLPLIPAAPAAVGESP